MNISAQEATIEQFSQTDTLKSTVKTSIQTYFDKLGDLGGDLLNNLYDMVLSEIEEPLLIEVMRFTRGNQSKAAVVLGISRGTLRKKLKRYGLLT